MTIQGAHGFRMEAPGFFAECELPPLEPKKGEVVVEVAGCGLCHTDVSFAYGGVPTRHPLPLILGHEISGRVVDGEPEWIGRKVIIPAVIPCGTCDACKAGRPTICRSQFMPGNDGDGGFASHILVPARGLCPVPESGGLKPAAPLELLSVVADAVTTPYEAIARAEVGPDDLVVVIGVGGIGGFAVQIAAALGATVVAVDVDESRLALALLHGATLSMNPEQVSAKAMKDSIRGLSRSTGHGCIGTKIFEMSGTVAGQQTAFSLLDFGSYLAVVGYTTQKVEVRLSNLMALDATARGNWGCSPANYPKALALVLEGKVKLEPFVDVRPLADLPALFEAASRHELKKRVILAPRSGGLKTAAPQVVGAKGEA